VDGRTPFHRDAGRYRRYLTLSLENFDCVARIFLNGEEIAETHRTSSFATTSMWTGKVRAGANTLRIEFARHRRPVAKVRSDAHPFPIPFTYNYVSNGLPGVHMNFVRKTACHAGWDWGIRIMPIGVYGRMAAAEVAPRPAGERRGRAGARQELGGTLDPHSRLRVCRRLGGADARDRRRENRRQGRGAAGRQCLRPQTSPSRTRNSGGRSGQGEPVLYPLWTTLDGEVTKRRIGLRKLEWIVEKDAIDHSFKVRVNGRDITAMGANWIPADAIPSRITPTVVRDLIESAAAVNMNMLRVWGGGQYEPDYFYEICDELGIMVWQDFMFACMSYPSDRAFLADVRTEITQQVRRLQPSCLHRALVRRQRSDRLAHLVSRDQGRPRALCRQLRPPQLDAGQHRRGRGSGRRFWPSSPSLGYLDFSDGWHKDTRGDTHLLERLARGQGFLRLSQRQPTLRLRCSASSPSPR